MDRKKIEIIVAVLVIVALIVVLVLVLKKPADQAQVTGPGDQQPSERVIDRVSQVDSRTKESPPDIVARTFVERFGSYSTDIDYANVEDVMSLATAGLTTKLAGLLADARSAPESGFYGVSTRVISMDTVEQTEEAAQIKIKTQRQETFDNPSNTSVRYQDISVELTKSGNRWLVSNFTWAQ